MFFEMEAEKTGDNCKIAIYKRFWLCYNNLVNAPVPDPGASPAKGDVHQPGSAIVGK